MGGYTPKKYTFNTFSKWIYFFQQIQKQEAVFADSFAVAGIVREIKAYLDIPQQTGPQYGYFLKPLKYYLIVKEQSDSNAVEMFRESEVKITSEGTRYTGIVVGSQTFNVSCTKSLVDNWIKQQLLLTRKAEAELKSVYSVFIARFKGKVYSATAA